MNISVIKFDTEVENLDLSDIIAEASGPFTLYIGRSEECQIVLDDRKLSRETAELSWTGTSWSVKSISDTCPVMKNGRPVDVVLIKTGDQVSIGDFTLRFDFDELPTHAMSTVREVDVVEEIVEEELEAEGVEGMDETALVEEVVEEDVLEEDVLEDSAEGPSLDSSDEGEAGFGEEDGFGEESTEAEFGEGDSSEDSGEGTVTEFASDDESGFEEGSFGEEESTEGDGEESEYDEYGDDEEYGNELEGYNEDSTQVFRGFASFELEISGEFAPFEKYTVSNPETLIGRDPAKCDIVLNDPEVSSAHAKIIKSNILCRLEDLNSGNGSMVNGSRVNSVDLKHGDEILIGSTSLTINIQSDFLNQEEDRLMPVEEGQQIEVEEIVEVGEDYEGELEEYEGEGGLGVAKPEQQGWRSYLTKEALQDPEKKKRIYMVVGVLVLLLMLWEPAPKKKNVVKKQNKDKGTLGKKKLSKEEIEFVDSQYQLAKSYFEGGKFKEAMFEAEKVFPIVENYKNLRQIYGSSNEGLKKIEEKKRKEREKREREERAIKVKGLIAKAKKAVEERRVELAKGLFTQILQLDPENFEVTQFKVEIDAYEKEQKRLAIEREQKKAERARQIDMLNPGKGHYLKKEWYKAVQRLEGFLKERGLHEDLIQEGTKMLDESKTKLNSAIAPLVGKARSLKEGQDLKGAYENYLNVLKLDPNHVESLNEMSAIRDILSVRSRKAYREAIISESLSLFEDAKEKFQEVQQISPTDSEYYLKASEKLMEYLE